MTLAFPQDTQTEAYDYPVELFEIRVWHIQRNRADEALLAKAVSWIRQSKNPILVAGGGAGAVLFAAGVALGYAITLPVAVKVMFYFNAYLGTTANWKIDSYLGFAMQLLIGFGLAFELPLILLALGRLGVVTTNQMRQFRRHVVVGILVVAMVLTPPDVPSQLQMAIPLYVLYESCIWILRLLERRDRKSKEGTIE